MTCCGFDMVYAEVFGIRIYRCVYRHHPQVYVRQSDGAKIEETELTWTGGISWDESG